MVEKIEQLQEDLVVEKNKEKKDRKWLNMVALSTALLAAFAAIAAMRGNYLANEAMLSQLKANDQWELYQAKSMKRHLDQTSVTLLQALEQESRSNFKRHELFAYSVAVLQVGISLGAVAVLLSQPFVWYFSLILGTIGLGLSLRPFSCNCPGNA